MSPSQIASQSHLADCSLSSSNVFDSEYEIWRLNSSLHFKQLIGSPLKINTCLTNTAPENPAAAFAKTWCGPGWVAAVPCRVFAQFGPRCRGVRLCVAPVTLLSITSQHSGSEQPASLLQGKKRIRVATLAHAIPLLLELFPHGT